MVVTDNLDIALFVPIIPTAPRCTVFGSFQDATDPDLFNDLGRRKNNDKQLANILSLVIELKLVIGM